MYKNPAQEQSLIPFICLIFYYYTTPDIVHDNNKQNQEKKTSNFNCEHIKTIQIFICSKYNFFLKYKVLMHSAYAKYS